MATKGSTSGQSIEKIREREKTRRDARKAAKRAPRQAEPKPKQDPIVSLRMVLRKPAHGEKLTILRQVAYDSLTLPCLTRYAPKYKHHDHRQAAVMKGEIWAGNLPLSEANRIAQELKLYGWVRPAKEG